MATSGRTLKADSEPMLKADARGAGAPGTDPTLTRRASKQFIAYDKQSKPAAAIFEGGGSKGIAYAGAVKRFHEAGVFSGISRFGGTSAGAQTAMYLAIGCTGEELSKFNAETDWAQVFDKPRGCCAAIRSLSRLHHTFAVCKGEYLRDQLETRCKEKTGLDNITFQQLYDTKKVELHLGVCELRTTEFLFLSKETTPDMPISLGAMASSSLPLIFPPVMYTNPKTNQELMLCDGGLMGNLPVKAFEHHKNMGIEGRILAFHLHSDACDATAEMPNSFASYKDAILKVMFWGSQHTGGAGGKNDFSKERATWMRDNMGVDMIHVDCLNCGTVEADMTDERRNLIEQCGYNSADDYLSGTLS